ncbi:MAG: hypothetical protein KME32_01110 [Mojavia pulchra JT2-VF2]|uniref:Uncharacterized protein n=1 Tax=Mojavia pulchra JT2-VF2 TaxID=287848 RepID=A0A951PT83_9NOST|nr:hypothetical protein [Mojavia pulchra JT2-VF2]
MPLPLSTWLNLPLDTPFLRFPPPASVLSCLGTSPNTTFYLEVRANAEIKAGKCYFDKGVSAPDERAMIIKNQLLC